MISSLVREQLRAQRRYVGWAAGVVALAVGVAAYGGLIAVELDQAADETNRALVLDTEFSGHALWYDPAAPAGTSLAETDDAIDEAIADGVRLGAQATSWGIGVEPGSGVPWATAVWGDIDWSVIMTEGAPPATGEVALSEAYAERLGVGVGDTVSFYKDASSSPLGVEATVSGLTRSPFDAAGLGLWALHDLWVSPDDIVTYSDAAAALGSGPGATWDVIVTWDGSRPELDPLFAATGGVDTHPGTYAQTGDNFSQGWVFLALAVLVLGAIATGFAFGRAQAQSRTQWVATARALGASRRHIVAATLLEAGLLAVVGGAIGYVLGTLGATAHLAVIHAQVPGAGIAAIAGFSPVVAGAALLLAGALGLVIAGVPAFWSARVSPSVALKPENDITASEVGRRIQFWPVALVWTAAAAGTALTNITGRGETLTWAACLLATLVLSPVVANEALRWTMPRVGRWLSRRPEKAAMVAGDMIVARPRQYTVPALLVAIGAAALLFTAATSVIGGATAPWENGGEEFGPKMLNELMWPTWLAPATLITMGAIGALATVIAVATTTVTEAEQATRQALGVTARQSRGAAGLAHLTSQFTGLLLGVVFAAGLTIVVMPWHVDAESTTLWDPAFDSLVRALAIVGGVTLVVSAIGAGVVTAASKGLTRVPSRDSEGVLL